MRIGLSLAATEPRYNLLAQNIRALFADGSQGWWYDDNDTTTLFQDSAGTTPVTAVEQFVGLQLDKSKGLVLGPDIIVNGDYSAGTANWTAFGTNLPTLSAANNQLTVSLAGPSGSAGAYQAITTVIGKWYIVRAPQINVTGVSPRLRVGTTIDGSENANVIVSNNSNSGAIFLATSTTTYISLRATLNTAGVNVIWGPVSTRELPGNHRYAPASGNRPIWSKRVNLLTKTEQFDDAVWTKANATITANATTAPDGTTTADAIKDVLSAGQPVVIQAVNIPGGVVYSCYVKQVPGSQATWCNLRIVDGGSARSAFVNLTTGAVGVVGLGSVVTADLVGNGWVRITHSRATPISLTGYSCRISPATADGVDAWTGTGNDVIYVWGADLRPANQATGTMPLYQRVNTSTDYDTNGFPGYLKADGVDDFLQTNSIDFNTVTSDGLPRRNLFVNPTQFDTATWLKSNATVTANATTAPNGANTAYAVVEDGTTNPHRISTDVSVTSGVAYTLSIYVKKDNIRYIQLCGTQPAPFPTGNGAWFDLDTGTASAGTSTTAAMLNIGNGWYRCAITVTAVGTGTNSFFFNPSNTNTTPVYTGVNGRTSVFLWGAQVEVGSTATAFQNIGTDKITLCAGVRKLSDAASAMFAELSVNAVLNTGAFNVQAPVTGGNSEYRYLGGGTTVRNVLVSGYAAPITNVLTGVQDISGDSILLRINGTQVGSTNLDQGTGNLGNYPAYFFRRGGTTLPFNGYEYGNIAVGKLLTADQLTALETYMNGLTKAY